MTMKKFIVLLVVASTFHRNAAEDIRDSRSVIYPMESSEGQGKSSCITPRGSAGFCIPVTNCQMLKNRQNNYRLLRRLHCGFEGDIPKVCCPVCNDKLNRTEVPNTPIRPTSTKSPPPGHNLRRPLVGVPDLAPGRKGQDSSQTDKVPTTKIPSTHTSRNNTPLTRKVDTGKSSTAGRNYDDILSILPIACGRNDVPLRRVVGGHESVIGAWPWLAALYFTRRGISSAECGGALVTSKHVITAAHCTVNSRTGATVPASQLSIRLGDHDLSSDEDGLVPVNVPVQSIIKHELFVLRTFQNDIAILLLAFEVQFHKYIAPICLPYNVFDDDLTGRNAFVAGWGTISFDGPASSKVLEVQLRIWDNRDCESVFLRDVPITPLNLCAGDGDKDACRGDSGGPLMLPHRDGRFYMVGIVSFGKKCAEPGIPGVYTRITSFLDWIADTILITM